MNSDESKTPNQNLVSSSSDNSQEPLSEPINVAKNLNYDRPESLEPNLVKLSQESNYPESEPLDWVEEPLSSRKTQAATQEEELAQRLAQLELHKQTLEAEIRALQTKKNQMLSQQTAEVQQTLAGMVKEGMRELEQQKQALQISIEQLERRRERIREEMRTSFAGVSQELAIRVQGFK
ncbi:MAG: DUF3086 domain-containing protein, partial [Prochloraceae cyanobacterium]